MATFRVTVCLPPTEPADVVAALTAALAPFDMNRPGEWNEQGHWDWWTVRAGRERLLVKAGHIGDARLVHQGVERGEAPPEPPSAGCDGGPRGLLDLDATRERAARIVREEWDAAFADWERAVADHPPARPWAWFQDRHEADPRRYPLEQARIDHREQPLNQALADHTVTSRYPNVGMWCLGSDPVAYFACGGQQQFDLAADYAVATWALLTTDGTWIDGDQDDQGTGDAHLRSVAAYLEALDDDVLMIQVLCHC
ncbi:hypothetical protein [Longispora urticae]